MAANQWQESVKEALKGLSLVPVAAPADDRRQAICVQRGTQNGERRFSTRISLEVALRRLGTESLKTGQTFNRCTVL
jgi:hypothetical protein